jgi:orotate phosphoribosyltransferase
MIQNKDSACKVADFLLQIKAVKLQPSKPFTWASGIKSPIYCDNRKTLSYPKIRTYLRQQFVSLIAEKIGKPELIAGVAMGGIPHGVLIAQELGLPFVYIRGEAKDHGTKNKIEGDIQEGQAAVVIEDLISTGSSSLKAAETLRNEKCNVKGIVSIFTYSLKTAVESFKKAKIPVYSLCDYPTLISRALETKYITEKEVEILEEWAASPADWLRFS